MPTALALVICTPMIIVAAGMFARPGEEWQHIRSTLLLDYVVETVALAVGVTAGASIIGTVLAWFTVNYEFPGSRIFSWLLGLPIALPAYISAYTYAHITGVTGPVFTTARSLFGPELATRFLIDIMSLPGCIFIMTLALYPYVYFTARSYFAGSSRTYIETARSCGRGDFSIFLRVALPVARPAIVAGGALVLMETLNEYGATSYYGVNTMVTGIFRAWFSLGDVASAVRLSGYFLVAVIAVLSLERVSRRRRRYEDASPRPFDTVRPGRPARIAMTVVSLTVLSLGLLIPVAQLAAWVVRAATSERLAALAGSVLRSAALAAVSGIACVAVSIVVVHFVRNRKSPVTLVATEALLSGYAVPGAIIVVGILALSQFVERQTTVFLFGSIGLLVYAYVVRYLAITTKPFQASISKIPSTFDDAAMLTGRGRFGTFLRVHLPMMQKAVSAGLLVVCIDLLKELPITLVLRPFNFSTLATRAFELAQQDRLPESAIPALTIVVIGMIPAALLSGRSAKPRAGTEKRYAPRAA